MHELAADVTSINPYYGPVLNPYNITYHVGGSSGGSGAAVAARESAVALCTDTGGSCRIPAALNGKQHRCGSVVMYNKELVLKYEMLVITLV